MKMLKKKAYDRKLALQSLALPWNLFLFFSSSKEFETACGALCVCSPESRWRFLRVSMCECVLADDTFMIFMQVIAVASFLFMFYLSWAADDKQLRRVTYAYNVCCEIAVQKFYDSYKLSFDPLLTALWLWVLNQVSVKLFSNIFMFEMIRRLNVKKMNRNEL